MDCWPALVNSRSSLQPKRSLMFRVGQLLASVLRDLLQVLARTRARAPLLQMFHGELCSCFTLCWVLVLCTLWSRFVASLDLLPDTFDLSQRRADQRAGVLIPHSS